MVHDRCLMEHNAARSPFDPRVSARDSGKCEPAGLIGRVGMAQHMVKGESSPARDVDMLTMLAGEGAALPSPGQVGDATKEEEDDEKFWKEFSEAADCGESALNPASSSSVAEYPIAPMRASTAAVETASTASSADLLDPGSVNPTFFLCRQEAT